MIARVIGLWRRPVVKAIALSLLFALILLLRRGDSLLVPSVWNEDGKLILPDIVHNGLLTLVHSLNGYFVTIPKLIDLIAFGVSATQYPLINAILAWLVAIGVGLTVAFAPTVLRHRSLAALAVFLVPTDPEVFGIGLYTLWWAGILLLLVALWKPGEGRLLWRVLILGIAGLSSPVILIVAPLLVVRSARWRMRAEIVSAAVAVAAAIMQGIAIIENTVNRSSPAPTGFNGASAPKMVGEYLAYSWTGSATIRIAAGFALAFVLIAGSVLVRGRPRWPAVALGYLLVGEIVLSLARTGGLDLDPVHAGPRYFFYPFVLISWFLLWLVTSWRWRPLVAVPIALLVLGLVNLPPGWSRHNVDLRWAQQVRACAAAEGPTVFEVQFAGTTDLTWHFSLDGRDCRAWLARDPFAGSTTG